MNREAKDLALAILATSGSASPVGKTRLLKLLYLADIENFRERRRTMTGFDWKFYLYGPWAHEYDVLLNEMESEGTIGRQVWSSDQREGEHIRGLRSVSFLLLGIDLAVAGRIRQIVENWAERPLGELLDYVYFGTEPMEGAEKGERLSFETVPREAPELYKRASSGASQGELAGIRRRLKDAGTSGPQAVAVFHGAPRDEVYLAALEVMNSPEAD